jgi:hypothetical protein
MTDHPSAYDCVICAAHTGLRGHTHTEWLDAFLTDAIAQRSTERKLEACHEHEPDLAAAILRREGRPPTAREQQVETQKQLLDQNATRPLMRRELTGIFGGLAANPIGSEHHDYFKGEYDDVVKEWLFMSEADADDLEASYQLADERHKEEMARLDREEGYDDEETRHSS